MKHLKKFLPLLLGLMLVFALALGANAFADTLSPDALHYIDYNEYSVVMVENDVLHIPFDFFDFQTADEQVNIYEGVRVDYTIGAAGIDAEVYGLEVNDPYVEITAYGTGSETLVISGRYLSGDVVIHVTAVPDVSNWTINLRAFSDGSGRVGEEIGFEIISADDELLTLLTSGLLEARGISSWCISEDQGDECRIEEWNSELYFYVTPSYEGEGEISFFGCGALEGRNPSTQGGYYYTIGDGAWYDGDTETTGIEMTVGDTDVALPDVHVVVRGYEEKIVTADMWKSTMFSSSDDSVFTFDENNNTMTAVGPGTAELLDGAGLYPIYSGEDWAGDVRLPILTVTVKQPVTGITIPEALTLTVGDAPATLTATVAPENASDKSLTWNSSDESVATVDADGNVTAVAAGSATITATANDSSGVSATCAVTVQSAEPALTAKARVSGMSMNLSDSMALRYFVKDVDASVAEPTFKITRVCDGKVLAPVDNETDYATSKLSTYMVSWNESKERWEIQIKVYAAYLSSDYRIEMFDGAGEEALPLMGFKTQEVATSWDYKVLTYLEALGDTALYNAVDAYGTAMEKYR